MIIEITQTTLKRLTNYRDVVQKNHMVADRQQWRVMTLEMMQAAEEARACANQVGAACAYAGYLHRLQAGQERSRDIYGEPLLSQALGALLKELSIEQRMLPEAETGASFG